MGPTLDRRPLLPKKEDIIQERKPETYPEDKNKNEPTRGE